MKLLQATLLALFITLLLPSHGHSNAAISALWRELLLQLGETGLAVGDNNLEEAIQRAAYRVEKISDELKEKVAQDLRFSLGRPTSRVAQDFDAYLAAHEQYIRKLEADQRTMEPLSARLQKVNEYATKAYDMAFSIGRAGLPQGNFLMQLAEGPIEDIQRASGLAKANADFMQRKLKSSIELERRMLDGFKNWLTKPACGNPLKPAPCKNKVPRDAPGGRFDGGGVGAGIGAGGVKQ